MELTDQEMAWLINDAEQRKRKLDRRTWKQTRARFKAERMRLRREQKKQKGLTRSRIDASYNKD